MIDITRSHDAIFSRLGASIDMIGWRRFMEGMISKEIIGIQTEYYDIQGGKYTPTVWCQ